ncbi:MAG TPA: sensor histidine kinase [Gemmatimonadales bacterium]|nr:sensor histidine kinase [Gemmatimonadales bacterium]
MAEATLIGRLVSADYAPRLRAERLIATGRVVLAALSLLAVWLDPSTPAKHAPTTHILLIGYVAYALIVAMVVWLAPVPPVRLGLVTHVLDLLLFCLLTYLTEGPTSPFFTFFMFSIVGATLRWQWRGALWTAAAALVTINAIGVYADEVSGDHAFEQHRFIIPSVYLAVTAGLLGYLGAYEERRRREMSELAAWPQVLARQPEVPPPELLEGVARILGAPRVLLAWEEPEEPWLHLALWGGGDLRSWREAPETFDPVVAEPLAGRTFLSRDVRAPVPIVLYRGPDEPRGWRGTPIHPALQARFTMAAVLCQPLHGECLDGHLFALDKPRMTTDDLLLGEVVAHQVASSMDQSLLSRRLRHAAAVEERHRLLRDLHDGVLQSLTGAALQLETVPRLWDTNPRAARERLAAIQRLIVDEQRDLRFYIRDSRLATIGLAASDAGLSAGLRELIQRFEGIWGLRVELQLEHMDHPSADALANDVYLIVQEALVNAARHAAASEVRVAVARENGRIRIVVADNGRGFPFQGEYDHAALMALRLGPVMLKERVQSVGGTLAIRSSAAGARLAISLPSARGDD